MNTSTDQPPAKPARKFSERGIGVFMVIGSGVLAYCCIISPLLAASHHEEDVSISMKGVVFVPALFTIGLALVCTGDRPSRLFGTREKPSVFAWVILSAAAGIGILLYEWLKSRLRSYGYGF
jgi:hypothetical protein